MNKNKELARAVMQDAWHLYHQLVAEDPSAANRATFALCLRYAWERHPARYAARIRMEWAAQGAAAQLNSCRNMVRAAAKTRERKCGAYIDFTALDPDDLASETWCIFQERLDCLEATQTRRNAQDQLPLRLGALLHRAAAESLRRAVRENIREAQTEEYLPEEPYDESLEQNSSIRAALNSIKNPTQKAVLALMIQGLTVREIAASMDKSKSTTQRIIDAIRAQIADRLGMTTAAG